MPPKQDWKLYEALAGAVYSMTIEKLTNRVSIYDYKGIQRQAHDYQTILTTVVDECISNLCLDAKYSMLSDDDKTDIKKDTIQGFLEEEAILPKADGYHVRSINGFFSAKAEESDTLQPVRPNTGFKFHISVQETPPNMQRAWHACLNAARHTGISSFKMVEGSTVEDKKGRQVTVYLQVAADEVAGLAARVPDIIKDFACAMADARVIPDPRGMPDDCKLVPGSRYISYRSDYFPFAHPEESYDPRCGDEYLSQDHLECAKYVIQTVGLTSVQESDNQAIEAYMSQIPELTALDEGQQQMFISDVKEVLQVARAQAQQHGEEPNWHNLNPREEDRPLGAALEQCRVSDAAMMRAEYQGWRRHIAIADVSVVHEPLAREALSREEETERNATETKPRSGMM